MKKEFGKLALLGALAIETAGCATQAQAPIRAPSADNASPAEKKTETPLAQKTVPALAPVAESAAPAASPDALTFTEIAITDGKAPQCSQFNYLTDRIVDAATKQTIDIDGETITLTGGSAISAKCSISGSGDKLDTFNYTIGAKFDRTVDPTVERLHETVLITGTCTPPKGVGENFNALSCTETKTSSTTVLPKYTERDMACKDPKLAACAPNFK